MFQEKTGNPTLELLNQACAETGSFRSNSEAGNPAEIYTGANVAETKAVVALPTGNPTLDLLNQAKSIDLSGGAIEIELPPAPALSVTSTGISQDVNPMLPGSKFITEVPEVKRTEQPNLEAISSPPSPLMGQDLAQAVQMAQRPSVAQVPATIMPSSSIEVTGQIEKDLAHTSLDSLFGGVNPVIQSEEITSVVPVVPAINPSPVDPSVSLGIFHSGITGSGAIPVVEVPTQVVPTEVPVPVVEVPTPVVPVDVSFPTVEVPPQVVPTEVSVPAVEVPTPVVPVEVSAPVVEVPTPVVPAEVSAPVVEVPTPVVPVEVSAPVVEVPTPVVPVEVFAPAVEVPTPVSPMDRTVPVGIPEIVANSLPVSVESTPEAPPVSGGSTQPTNPFL